MKNIIIIILTAIILFGGYYYITATHPVQPTKPNPEQENNASSTENVSNTSTTTDEEVTLPHIDSISPIKGEVGTVITLKGKNLGGFAGDLDAWIESGDGKLGYLPAYGTTAYPETNTITVQITETVCTQNNTYSGKPCESLFTIEPGVYTIYTRPWGNDSNKVTFTVTESDEVDVSGQDAFLMEAYSKDGKDYVVVDYIDNLHGNEALEAMREDGKCEVGVECMVYPNGYKRNLNPKLRTLEVSQNAEIKMQGVVGAVIVDIKQMSETPLTFSFEDFSEGITTYFNDDPQIQPPYVKPKTYVQIDVKNSVVTKIFEPYQS